MKKPIIVTGLSGMVGSRFQQLFSESYQMNNMDLTVEVDITNLQQVREFMKSSQAETVLHLAAFTNVSAAHEQNGNKDGACYQVNVIGTRNIAYVAEELGKRLVHVSTDYVFDGEKNDVYTEDDEPNPIEWYGETKYLAEKEVMGLKEKYVILRIAYPYQSNPTRTDFLENVKTKLASGTLPPAFTDHVITPVFVDDLCQVFDYCIRERPTGLYHAMGSSWHTDYEIATMVNEAFGLEGEVREGSLVEYLKKVKRPYQKQMKVSNEKLKSDFGLEMKTLEEGLEEVIHQLA